MKPFNSEFAIQRLVQMYVQDIKSNMSEEDTISMDDDMHQWVDNRISKLLADILQKLQTGINDVITAVHRSEAQKHFLLAFNYNVECSWDVLAPHAKKRFEERAGFTLDEACDPESKHFVLDRLYDRFVDAYNPNVSVNETWETVVTQFLTALYNHSAESGGNA